MNEELQRELLSILRAMKDGTPEAFAALVEARSIYCMATAITMVAVATLAVIFGRRSMRLIHAKAGDAKEIMGIIGTVTCAIAAITCGLVGACHIPEAIAPLGRVLEALR